MWRKASRGELNYNKYFVKGQVQTEADEACTSHNTTLLDVDGVVNKRPAGESLRIVTIVSHSCDVALRRNPVAMLQLLCRVMQSSVKLSMASTVIGENVFLC